ncbi:uncharacterized protein LOC112055830 [Bicyclus anynana]|uniref:Uncharacterized protein LOC112055830 n=1 Tax=Bicyclus anynana TaxID=110368 RepID=A0ABM3M3Z4_BICAN|nr:uncharacterized protein LOC112055830 [Bicyclus anynana]
MQTKLRHANLIRERHEQRVQYKLGSIAAGIQGHFRDMLNYYRSMAEIKSFKRETYDVWAIITAFTILQGKYNEIRLECGLYRDIVQELEKTSSTHGYTTPARTKRATGRRANTWRPRKLL